MNFRKDSNESSLPRKLHTESVSHYVRTDSAITLIALVITIIVLLILAGVSLNLVSGGDGILGKASKAVDETAIAQEKEQLQLVVAACRMDIENCMTRIPFEYFKEKFESEYGTTTATIEEVSSRPEEAKILGLIKKILISECYAAEEGILDYTRVTYNETGRKYYVCLTRGLEEDKMGQIFEDPANTVAGEQGNGGSTDGGSQEPDGSGEGEEVPETTKYTVSYNANGGTGSVPASAEYEKDASVTVDFDSVPTKEGYKFLGWAETAEATTATYTSDGTTSFTMGTANVTLYAVWRIDRIGDYVDLETTLLPRNNKGVITQKLGGENPKEQPLTDWRIFHEDNNGMCLILADYLPYSYETSAVAGSSTGLGTGLFNAGANYPYNWRSVTSRIYLIDRLKGTASAYEGVNPWNKLLASAYIDKGITVTGTLSLDKWIESWNDKYSSVKLYTDTHSNLKGSTQRDGLDGFYIGTSENLTTSSYSVNLSSYEGFGNTLYFPHTVALSEHFGYWLASPSALGADCLMNVGYSGRVNYYTYDDDSYGVRPAVFIPSDIQAEKVGDVWELDI